jgi:branched-chain amino acid transport system substrate-binding protein
MKRSVSKFLLCSALIALLVSCKRHGTEEVPIGVILPLSGGGASLGKACLNGVQLAADDFNADSAGSLRVRLIVEDDQLKPAVGVSVFQKLTSVDKVKAVIGPLSSGVTLAVAPLAENAHVVILSPGASAPALTTAGDYIFRNELSEQYGAKIQAELAIKPLGFKRIAMFYPNNEYGVGTATVFRESYAQLGGKIVGDEAFQPETTDFRTALTRIKRANPDAIFVIFQDEIVNIVKQKTELAVPGTIYTTPVIEDSAILHDLGSLAEGIIHTHYGTFDSNASTGRSAEFVKRYVARFGQTPTYYSAQGYDAGALLFRALKDAGGNTDSIKSALHQIKSFPGVTGETSFDKNGDVTKPVSLRIIRNGQSQPYQ